MLRFGSLFSGVGLLDLGLSYAGIEHAWFCESDPWRREILAKRWPGVPVHEDVRKLRACDVVPVDGVVGGFPCKGVSSAGKQAGFDHPETVLWREMARVVGELRPAYVVLENVVNILTLKKGLVWQEVLETLATLGFDVVWDVLPAAAVGAPHLRQRVIAVACYAAGEGRPAGWESEYPEQERVGHVSAQGSDVAADASRDAEGGAGSQAGTDGEQIGQGDHAAADAEREPLELRGGPGAMGEAPGGARGEVRQQRARHSAATGTQNATDADGGRCEAGQEQDLRPARGQPAPFRDDADGRGVRVEWGEYEPAIRRWEQVHGPAPEPLVRGVDDRSARRVERSRLSALGDGVQVQVGQLVGDYVVWLDQQRRLQQEERENVAHA